MGRMMKIGFAVIAEKGLLEKIVQVENMYHNESGFYNRLGMEHNLPHTTIFQGDMDDGTDYAYIAGQIAEKIRGVYSCSQPEIMLENVVYVPEGWYFWECVKSEELVTIHNYTLDLVKPFIRLNPERMNRKTEDLPKEQIKALEVYGYRFAAEAFYPHITIGRSDRRNESVLELLNSRLKPQKARIERVTVYKMGENGTHESTLFEEYI